MNLVTQSEIYGHSVTAKISEIRCDCHLLLLRCRRQLTKPSLLHNSIFTFTSCRQIGMKKACVICSNSYLHTMHSFTTNESVGIETWKYIHCILLRVKAAAWQLQYVVNNTTFYFIYNDIFVSGFGGLGVACWPLVPKFAGSNPAEAVGFSGAKKSSARLPSEGK